MGLIATRDREHHRTEYVVALTRLAKAHLLSETERRRHLRLYSECVEAAEFHRSWAMGVPRAEAEALCGDVTAIAERWARDGVVS